MTTPDFAVQVARVATERAAAWDALLDTLTAPAPAVVERLRSGELAQTWRAGVRWLGQDSDMFTAALLTLDVYARGADRRSPDDDLAVLVAGRTAVVGPVAGPVVGPVAEALESARTVAALCRDEAAAWSRGDVTAGKDLRAQQHAFVEQHLLGTLPELGARLVRESPAGVWRAIGQLLLAFLTAETGKDYQRAVLGSPGAVDPGSVEPGSVKPGGSADPNGLLRR